MKRWTSLLMVVALFAFVAPGACIDDNPTYTPPGASSSGPSGAAAFMSGEALRSGFEPTETPDVTGGGPDTQAADTQEPNDTGGIQWDFGFPSK